MQIAASQITNHRILLLQQTPKNDFRVLRGRFQFDEGALGGLGTPAKNSNLTVCLTVWTKAPRNEFDCACVLGAQGNGLITFEIET